MPLYQARTQGHTRQIDHLGFGWNPYLLFRSDGRDRRTRDDHNPSSMQRCAVENAIRFDDDVLGECRCQCEQKAERNQ